MIITIDYIRNGETEWQHIDIPESQYYENDAEGYDIDSVPIFNHAYEYLKLPASEINKTILSIKNENRGEYRLITEAYWNHGMNRIIGRKDHTQEGDYAEYIVESAVSSDTQSVMRFVDKKNMGIELTSHVHIAFKDGVESEQVVYPSTLTPPLGKTNIPQ